MTTDEPRTRRASTTTATLLALAASAMLLAPGAAATGYLVNAEVDPVATAKTGTNPFGGQGDFLDAGVFNHQCSDEDDVVDVGVANQEGTAREDHHNEEGYSCTEDQEGCQAEEGGNTHVVILGTPVHSSFLETQPVPASPDLVNDSDGDQHESACTDDGDTLDVGVVNEEGRYESEESEKRSEWEHCDEAPDGYWDHFGHEEEETKETGPERDERGDRDDTVDAGAANSECRDQRDFADAGVLNCEIEDPDDGLDAGVFNDEVRDDAGDTLDVSVWAYEANDGPDGFGVNILPASGPGQHCEAFQELFAFLTDDGRLHEAISI